MSRPVDADSAKTYDKIVAAALTVLGEAAQPSEVSLRKVASEADVSLGTIQYYFGSKTDLLEACLDDYYSRLNALTTELVESTKTHEGRDYVEFVVRKLFQFAVKERALIELRIATNAARGELHPQRQGEFMGAIIVQAANVLAPHIEINEVDARLSVQAVSSIIVRFALLTDSELQHLTAKEGEEARQEVEDYVVRAGRRLLRPSDG